MFSCVLGLTLGEVINLLELEVPSGEDINLSCGFHPSIIQGKTAISYYWIRENIHDKDNVAIKEMVFQKNYR